MSLKVPKFKVGDFYLLGRNVVNIFFTSTQPNLFIS